MKLPGWYEEKRVGRWDGRAWTTNGHMMVAVDEIDDTDARTLPESAIARLMGDAMRDAKPATEDTREHGFVIMSGHVFCAHLIDLVMSLHPSATWKVGASEYEPASAHVGGRIVGIVMGNRTPRNEMAARPGYPSCATCGGSGGDTCDQCDGTGEHECDCGDEHDCHQCDGTGRYGKSCPTCGGDGRWKETTP